MDDRQLAEKCRSGSRSEQDDAWSEVVARYGKRVYNIAYHFTYRAEEAEELTQEIFLKLWQNLQKYDGSSSLVAWMVGISRNHCIDHYRKFKKERGYTHLGEDVLQLLSGPTGPGEDLDRKERLELLLRGIEQLPEELAEVVILRDLDDLSYLEISAALGLPEGTVKSRLNRARIELAGHVRALVGFTKKVGGTPMRPTEVN